MADGQAQAAAGAYVTCREGLEEACGQFIVDAAAMVAYAKHCLVIGAAQVDRQIAALRGMADCVVQKIAGQLAQHPLVDS